MIMKMHSYMSVNGYLQSVSLQSQSILAQLRGAADSEGGGWENSIRVAKENRAELDAPSIFTDSSTTTPQRGSSPAPGTPPIPEGAQASYVDPETAKALKRHLASMSESDVVVNVDANKVDELLTDKKTDEETLSPTAPHPLVDHPNEIISNLAKEYTEFQGELVSTGPSYIRWPDNITFKNFAVYMLIPTLVYELEYPRTNR